jgi:superfamily II DNA or RNA helicase
MRSFLEHRNAKLRAAYRELPSLLREHHGIEQTVLAGGYGYRQVMELIQNGADAILEAYEHGVPPADGNRIHVLLRESRLYVANTGAPLSEEGADALLSSHSSPKRGNQIGRFGLGFKSLLRLGGLIDLFTKASGAIRFDPERCREDLMLDFNVTEAPRLRLAWPLEEGERRGDGVLTELAWAETIVRAEVQAPETLEHLREEIRAFPAEFLLFFPVPTTLVLDDGENPLRKLRIEPNGNDQLLHDGSEVSRWRIAKRDVSIADGRAVADATHIHARDSVPLAWALPLEGKREETGRFWAFFPTHTPTFLSGILNAPWKLNSDRNAIIGGEWNSALMAEAARLIAETLPSLSTTQDPACPLDAFPRQLERRDEDAAPLVEGLWKVLQDAVVIPDAVGTLRKACELWRHPRDNAELAKRWQALAGPDDLPRFVHPSCLERQRGSRLNALAERFEAQGRTEATHPNLRRCEAKAWFEAVASTDTPKAVQVLRLAEAYASDCKPDEWQSDCTLLAIIPSQTRELMRATQLVFAPAGVSVPDRVPVASAVCDDAEAKRILAEVMKVQALDDSVWESVLGESLSVPSYPDAARDAGWSAFWARLRLAPPTVRDGFVTANRDRIRVRRRDATWAAADAVLLPGGLVSADDTPENQNVLVDSGMHGEDGAALTALGVCECPEGNIGPGAYPVVVGDNDGLWEWLNACRNTYKITHQNSASWKHLEPVRLTMPKGWGFLPRLSGAANARLTERFLDRITQGEFGERLQFGHSTVSSYPKIDVSHPLPWFVLKHGTVQVGDETVRLAAVVARRHEPALAGLSGWEHLSPALEKLEHADATHPPSSTDIQTLWRAFIKSLATPPALADDSLEGLWIGAARDGVVPDAIHGETGEVPLSQVFVTGSPDLARRVRTPERIVITLDEAALALWVSKGARNLSELIRPEWASAAGPAELLLSTVPELADVLRSDAREVARCQPVSELKLSIDIACQPVACLMWQNTLLLDAAQLSQISRAQRMSLLVKEVAGARWLACSPDEALLRLGDARVDQLRAEVAQGATHAERLLRAVGGRREPLLEALGELKGMEFIQPCSPHQLAELTLAQLGPATLPSLKDTLEAEGLKPPARWNTSDARAFVTSIGFPGAFAASPEARREAEEFISGPIELPPLHDFQEEVFEGIRALLASGTTRRRAVVSLPTGGGKTRVTVEGAVRLVLAPERDRRSVVWVAQTDELCEQAVQAFRQVWINLGAQRTDLRIVRLWGGNPNPAIQESDKPVVVVASIQTLNSRVGTDGLAWLRKPGLVVVDECHHAITPSYSNLLRWLNAEAPRPGAPEKDEPPIVGLSATPFRTDDEESQRLAKRFDNRWFPPDQEDLHARLCSQGVLAKTDYEALSSGVGLLDEEIERLAGLPEPWEGLEFENILEAINQRLAGDAQRSQQLVERIQQGAERAILFFANSVQHAEEISARLYLAGISAAAVSGSTPTVARRYFLDRFQRGEIRVLCNHSVLSTGFDAPQTDMVLIARQVFSPVRYMQMVGRGLRGERNGGTPCCRVVTVVDNLGRFQDRHPYHYCQRYFIDWSNGCLASR